MIVLEDLEMKFAKDKACIVAIDRETLEATKFALGDLAEDTEETIRKFGMDYTLGGERQKAPAKCAR